MRESRLHQANVADDAPRCHAESVVLVHILMQWVATCEGLRNAMLLHCRALSAPTWDFVHSCRANTRETQPVAAHSSQACITRLCGLKSHQGWLSGTASSTSAAAVLSCSRLLLMALQSTAASAGAALSIDSALLDILKHHQAPLIRCKDAAQCAERRAPAVSTVRGTLPPAARSSAREVT